MKNHCLVNLHRLHVPHKSRRTPNKPQSQELPLRVLMPYNSRQFPMSEINFGAGFWHSKAKTHTARLAKKEPEFKSTFLFPRTFEYIYMRLENNPTRRCWQTQCASWSLLAGTGTRTREKEQCMTSGEKAVDGWFSVDSGRRTLVGACYSVRWGSPHASLWAWEI
jgi:hypothetical protein